MSTHPVYDPDPQVDPDKSWPPLSDSGREQVRSLIDSVVRTAAPRLGRTAVARIARPLTEALVALREEMLAEADARVAAALVKAAKPVAFGDVLTEPTHFECARLINGVVITNRSLLLVSADTYWYLPGEDEPVDPNSRRIAGVDITEGWTVERVPGGTS